MYELKECMFITVNGCTCFERGSFYGPALNGDCTTFVQYSVDQTPIELPCPPGTKFDVNTCVCNHAFAVDCFANCPSNGEYPSRGGGVKGGINTAHPQSKHLLSHKLGKMRSH